MTSNKQSERRLPRLPGGAEAPIRSARKKERGGTQPGTLRKQPVPIRTFADGADKAETIRRIGFVEVDWVQHAGESISD